MSIDTEKFNIFEWLFETLDKRMGPPYSIPLSELFLCIPYPEETYFDYDLEAAFNNGVKSGNVLAADYPHLHKVLTKNLRKKVLKVFFVHPSRLNKNLVLWTKKYNYPKIEQVSLSKTMANSIIRRVESNNSLVN